MSPLSSLLKEYKGGRIAVYGLSEETRRTLDKIGDKADVIGLLDGYQKKGEVFGKPVISLEQAVDEHVSLILVAARPGSCRAIAKRIGAVCRENRIPLFDIRGNNLCEEKRIVYDFKGVGGITKKCLMREIQAHEAVSFDLFDTLIMRRVLFQSDIFELMDNRLRQHGILIADFPARRMAAEKKLSQSRAPKLSEIYAYMKDTYRIPEIEPEQMAVLEWEIDCGLLVARREVCGIAAGLEAAGKNVYIVTDSYYDRRQIEGILKKCGMTRYTDLFVSCEYGTGKRQSLFSAYKKTVRAASYLHIGDDPVSDIESAQENGMDALRLYGGPDLLEASGSMGLWEYVDSLSDRIRAGMFTACVFNSPFQFETEERRIGLSAAYDIGYIFFAPMICDFVLWFREQAEKYRPENILFCARDGYLIKQLYDELCNSISSVYFLTSRMAAVRSGVEDEADLRYVEKMKFGGSLEKQLEERFGIRIPAEEAGGKGASGLSGYAPEILSRAAENRKHYKKYIEKLGLKKGTAAFFDFVAKGTTQMYMGRLMEQHLQGFYFLRLEEEGMRDENPDIISFYDPEEMERSIIFKDYYILETMLTAPMPSVKGFDERGKPVYGQETRKESDIRCFQEAQEGIRGYFREYLRLCPISERKVNKRLDEMFLTLIHGMELGDQDFLNLKVEDPFFNRMTDMADML